MANTLKFGNENWATKKDSILAYNDENANFKPLPFVTSRASTATRVNKAGLLETVASGVPRVDYLDNSKGSYLLEPQSTNLLTYSNDFSNISWDKETRGTGSAPIVTPNIVTSPDGTLNGDKIVFNTGNGTTTSDESFIEKGATTAVGVKVSQSLYLKGETGGETMLIRGAAGSAFTTLTLTDKWVRYDATETSLGVFSYFKLGLRQGVGGVAINSTATIYVYGAQFEEQSLATSYIPTNGSAITKLQDNASQEVPDGIINSSQGVLYAEISALSNEGDTYRTISLNDGSGTNTNRILIGYTNTDNIYAQINNIVIGITGANLNVKNLNKLAVVYNGSIAKLFLNGAQVGTGITTAPTLIGLDNITSSSGAITSVFEGNVKDLRVYNTALTDLELETLTQV